MKYLKSSILSLCFFFLPIFAADKPQDQKPSLVTSLPVKEEAAPVIPRIQKEVFKFVLGDSLFEFGGKYRLEAPFYGNNLKLLNNKNNDISPVLDRTLFVRQTIDLGLGYSYGRASCGYDIVRFRAEFRNRYIWGAEETIAPVSTSNFKIAGAVAGAHNHNITRNIFWARSLWLEVVLNDMLGFSSCHKHTLTVGLFPFQLGRGIALGDAYSVDPDFLGYQSPVGIDQYAPAFKISGDIVDQVLHYDLYAEIATNSAYSFNVVNEYIYAQRKGDRNDPQRGFASFDYILAGRLLYKPIDREGKRVSFEPYALYNHQSEEMIEFPADAKSDLGTFGLAFESAYNNFEFGFDVAFNVGHQRVFSWDKNIVTIALNSDGILGENYTNVRVGSPTGPTAPVSKENKKIVDADTNFGEEFNGKNIGGDLYNTNNRFNNSYKNTFRGAMFVGDMSYAVIPSRLKFAVMGAVSTGDEDPNKDLATTNASSVDKTFKGFVTLQELYSGTRVKSVFLLAGQSSAPRVLSIPSDELGGVFPSQVTRFSNIIVAGFGAQASPPMTCTVLDFRPNVLLYWAYHPPMRKGVQVDRFMGTEINLIIEMEILRDLRLFGTGCVFVPGGFFSDLKGVPLNSEQQGFLSPSENAPVKRVATLGDNLAYFIQTGLEYKF